MIRGLYTAAAGLLSNERQQEVVTNDVANITTPGFKEDDALLRSFPERLVYNMAYSQGNVSSAGSLPQPIGTLGSGVFVDEVLSRFDQGTVEQTNQPYDFAIQDSPQSSTDYARGFFALGGPGNTVLLTRDGALHRDANDLLTAANGLHVLAVGPNGQPITGSALQVNTAFDGAQLFDAAGQPAVDQHGNAAFTAVNGQTLQPLSAAGFGVVEVNDARKLTQFGNSGYTIGGATYIPLRATVQRGALEQSNVDPSRAMVNMMSVMRSYEANQKVIQTMDSTMDKAVNDVGRVQG